MRLFLRKILTLLTLWAIKKHNIEFVVVLGEKHSRLTSYILWEMLREKYFTRNQWDRSFWDLSVPLTILGYDAVRRTFIQWVGFVISATWVLATQTAKSQIIVLHMPYSLPEIFKYWLRLIDPKYLIAFSDDMPKAGFAEVISAKKVKILEIGSEIDEKFLNKNKITHDLPGVFWQKPVIAASYIAKMYKISNEEINTTLKNLEPMTFLKVREKVKE